MENRIYEEDFVKSHVLKDAESISYVLNEIKEVHSKEAGWTISDPEIIPNPDGKTVTLKVHLKKEYDLNQGRFR